MGWRAGLASGSAGPSRPTKRAHRRAPRPGRGSARPRSSKSRKASKLAQAGESSTTSPEWRRAAASRTARSRSPPASARPHARRRPGRSPAHRRLADQVAGDAALGDRCRPGRSKPPPFSDPPRIARTPPSKERSAASRRGDVGRLRVVDVEDSVDLRHPLEPVRDAGEGPERLARSGPRSIPIASAAAAAAIAFSTLCGAGQRQFGGLHQRLASPAKRTSSVDRDGAIGVGSAGQ